VSNGVGYDAWVAGYSGTASISLSTWSYYPGFNAVGVTISAAQTDGTTRTYSGSYTVNVGAITSASITQTSGGSGSGGGSGSYAPSGLTSVGNGVYASNASTQFALNVQSAAEASGYAYSITAYSPATDKTYTMTQTSTSPCVYTGWGVNQITVQFNS